MIVLDAPSIVLGANGVLLANGGGGGQGGTDTVIGDDGRESTRPAEFALGGKNLAASDGGFGGNGSAGATIEGEFASSNSQAPGGGGGGGGGAGFIRAHGVFGPTTIAPPSIDP
jgi:hypothetical protein